MILRSIDNIIYTFTEFELKDKFEVELDKNGAITRGTVATFVSNWKQLHPNAYEDTLYNLNNNLKLFTANQVPYVYRIFFRAIVPAWTEAINIGDNLVSTKPWEKLKCFVPNGSYSIRDKCESELLKRYTDVTFKEQNFSNLSRCYYISKVNTDCQIDEYPSNSLVSEKGQNLFKDDFAQSLFSWSEVCGSTDRSKNINLTGTTYKAYATLFPTRSTYSESSISTDIKNYSLAMDNKRNYSKITSVQVEGGYKPVPTEAPVNIYIYNPLNSVTEEAISTVTPYINFFYNEGYYSQADKTDGTILEYFVAPVTKVEVS